MRKKESAALVEVLRPETAYAEAKATFDGLAMTRPKQIRTVVVFGQTNDTLRQIATVKKLVEDKRKSVTKHLDSAKRAVNTLFKPMLDSLGEHRTTLEASLDEYDEWQAQEQEREREALERKAETARKRAEKTADTKLYAASSREMRQDIKQKLAAKLETQQAVLETRLADVDDTPDVAEGVARIEDVEITELDLSAVPELMALDEDGATVGLILWTRTPLTGNIKKLGKAGVEVPGVRFERTTRRAVRSL